VELHRAQSPQHTPLLQHDLLKLQGRLQLFAKRIGKAFHGLVSDQEPNPHLKLALKRFSKATQNLAQSPALSAAFREHFIKMNEALIAASELSDTDKQEAKANGSTRFCMGAAWRTPPHQKAFEHVLTMASSPTFR
jgi:hypothetical protein